MSGGLTPCRQLRPSPRREEVTSDHCQPEHNFTTRFPIVLIIEEMPYIFLYIYFPLYIFFIWPYFLCVFCVCF